MITNNNTEALATLKTQHIEGVYPDETYITVSSIFSRVGSYENPEKEASSAQPAPTLPVLQRRDTAVERAVDCGRAGDAVIQVLGSQSARDQVHGHVFW